jgi:hypothetical protein
MPKTLSRGVYSLIACSATWCMRMDMATQYINTHIHIYKHMGNSSGLATRSALRVLYCSIFQFWFTTGTGGEWFWSEVSPRLEDVYSNFVACPELNFWLWDLETPFYGIYGICAMRMSDANRNRFPQKTSACQVEHIRQTASTLCHVSTNQVHVCSWIALRGIIYLVTNAAI